MSWYVYLIVSRSLQYFNHSYVGITTDLNRRLDQHNGILSGGAKSTLPKRPYELAYSINNLETRSIASKLEYEIKQQKGFEKRLEYMKTLKKN